MVLNKLNTLIMNKLKNIFALIILMLFACNSKTNSESVELWKQEIQEVERSFAKLASEEGIHNAFVAFAADDAVLMRGNQLIKNKTGIDEFYKGNDVKTLSWAPDFVEVAASGDLAYTYGPFTFTSIDSSGNKTENKGIFHTVWKRQADGSWKYVWD